MVLDIKFPPRVKLQWGANIAEDSIGAGQDVYLECLSQANPPVSRLVWLQDNYRGDIVRQLGRRESYAIKNQRKTRNAPSRGLWVP